jgi:septum site-determining protein MinC
MVEKLKTHIMIKGTKEGLIFYMNDDCSFQDLIQELETTLKMDDLYNENDTKAVSVILNVGYRYVRPTQKETLQHLIEGDGRFFIERYDAEVIGKKEAENWFDQSEVKSITQIVRSGQIVEVTGDLLLIGDVNPGAQVKATGNIFVLGHLHGIAHAGSSGDEQAVIAASHMNPTQLRIANFISRAPDYEASGLYMECGYLDKENNKIAIDRLQVLPYIRKKLRAMERGIQHG